MIKLFSILGLLPTASSVAYVPQINNLNNKNEINKNIKDEIIDLDLIKLNKIKVNVYKLAEETGQKINEKTLFKLILTKQLENLVSDIDTREKVSAITRDFIKNPDDWSFLDFPSKFPNVSEQGEYPISVIYLGEGNFKNDLTFNVILDNANPDNKEILSNQFKITNLDKLDSSIFKSDSIYDNLWKLIFNNNSDTKVSQDDIEFIKIDYNSTLVQAKENSDFTGQCVFNYQTVFFDSSYVLKSTDAYIEKYSGDGWQDSVCENPLVITSNLGRDELLKNYSTLKYNFHAEVWDNEHGTDVLDFASNSPAKSEGHSNLNMTSIDLTKDSDDVAMVNRDYTNVNNMHSEIRLKWSWAGDALTIQVYGHVKVFASGWNVYYAKASLSNIRLSDFTFE